jgi:uncharacterized membrane protein YsdA (DUF1294 family)
MPSSVTIAVSYALFVNAITLIAYAHDKRRSIRGGRRIRETRLHLLELLGGWPGAYLASKLFRHKTQKSRFRIVRLMMTLLNILLVSSAVYGWYHWAG